MNNLTNGSVTLYPPTHTHSIRRSQEAKEDTHSIRQSQEAYVFYNVLLPFRLQGGHTLRPF